MQKQKEERIEGSVGAEEQDIEQIVNILVAEKVDDVEWVGKMPKGVLGIEKERRFSWYDHFSHEPYTRITITLKDRIDYDLIKKICETNNLSTEVDEVKIDEKGRHPIKFTIHDEGTGMRIMVNEDSLSFFEDEYVRYKKVGAYKSISAYKEHLLQIYKKINQKTMETIKTYLRMAYGEAWL
jgi:hypothetical protein